MGREAKRIKEREYTDPEGYAIYLKGSASEMKTFAKIDKARYDEEQAVKALTDRLNDIGLIDPGQTIQIDLEQ
jgi:hypothetical protein